MNKYTSAVWLAVLGLLIFLPSNGLGFQGPGSVEATKLLKLETIVDLAALISMIVAATSLLLGYQAYKRQVNMQVFLEYTKRYDEILDKLTGENRIARFSPDDDLPASNEELTQTVLRYLNLCSEEYYLWTKGYLAGDIWRIWEAELKRMLRSALVKREWNMLKHEFVSYPAFAEFVERTQSS